MSAWPRAHRTEPTLHGVLVLRPAAASTTTAACSPGPSTPTSSTTGAEYPGPRRAFVQDSQSRSVAGRDPRHARPSRPRRGQAGALRARRRARRRWSTSGPDSPTFGTHAGVPARRRRRSAHLYVPPGIPARLPGARPTRRRVLPHRPTARSRRGPRRRVQTTRNSRSSGRCTVADRVGARRGGRQLGGAAHDISLTPRIVSSSRRRPGGAASRASRVNDVVEGPSR